MSLFEATGHIGLPYLYLGCGFAKKALFFYFSSSLLCDAESTTTDNIVFRKPTSPSLPLRKAFSNSSLSIVFMTPSVPLVGDRNPFQRELHLFPQAPSSSEGGGCNRSSSELSFRKPTSPPFIDKTGCTRQFESELSLRSFAQLFPLREGPPRFFSKTYPSFLTVKEGSTSHLDLLPSGKKRKPLLLGAQTATL